VRGSGIPFTPPRPLADLVGETARRVPPGADTFPPRRHDDRTGLADQEHDPVTPLAMADLDTALSTFRESLLADVFRVIAVSPAGSAQDAPRRDAFPHGHWRDAVAEVVRSEVTRSLVTMFRGSTPRPAERRGRARRSSRRHRRDDSSSSSIADVSRPGDESAVAALLGEVRATPTPSTGRERTRGIDPRTLPTPDSVGGEQGRGAARELPRGIDQGLSWVYPGGIYPCIISVSTSDTRRGRIS